MKETYINRVLPGKFSINWFEDGILCGQFAPLLDLDLETVRTVIKDRKNFAGKNNYTLLVEISNVKSISSEARDYLASAEGTAHILAAAIITNSSFTRMISNLFLSYNKPLVPTKLFSNREEAKKWLQKYMLN